MQYFVIAVVALGLIVVASVFSRRTGIAPPLLLVALGLGGSYLPGISDVITIEPELVLAGLLPPLLFASAVRLPVVDLRRNLKTIAWLSIVLVIISAVVVGLVIHAVFTQIPIGLAIALGAVVSPTDAVAATAVGKRLGLPPRLMTVLEGESLVNDASALVVLRTAIASIGSTFSFWHAFGEFLWAVVGALIVGFAIGRVAGFIRSHLGDPVLVSAVSFAIPFAAYFLAEELEASGVLAVVMAGLTTGIHRTKSLSVRSRQIEATNWATISFIGESTLFLLMGLQLPTLVRSLEGDSAGLVIGGSAIVLGLLIAIRAIGMLVPIMTERRHAARRDSTQERLDQFDERLQQFDAENEREQRRLDMMRRRLERGRADLEFHKSEPIGKRGALVIGWAGMRGAITVAAAQTIPEDLPHRSAIVLIAFIVAAATLVGFGATLPAIIRKMSFDRPSREDKREEVIALLQSAVDQVTDDIGALRDQEIDGKPIDPDVAEMISKRFSPLLTAQLTQARSAPSADARRQAYALQRRYVSALREAVLDEQTIGNYRTETYAAALALIDREDDRLSSLDSHP